MARPTQTTGSKTCTKCGATKDITEFYKRGGKQSPDTRHNHCKECTKKRVSATPSIVKREQALKRMYGITHQDYEVMLEEQNNRCAICETTDPGGRHNSDYFVVDHCHTTGKVRKLLCHHCNTALGLVGDNTQILQSMIEYLRVQSTN
jgi:hypothetical protein